METVMERKCTECKNKITISYDDIRDVIYYKRLYYHDSCFCASAEKKLNGKCRNKAEWQDALDTIEEIRQYTKMYIKSHWPKEKKDDTTRVKRETDDLNDYLLSHYQVTAVDNRNFWRSVRELANGRYKGKKCRKVSLDDLLGAWKWGQRKLDDISKYNKAHHRGPSDDNERIPYDFAILVKKMPNYLAYKAKQDALMEEAKIKITHVNYDSMIRTEVKHEGLDDISDLLDDDDD